MAKEAVIDTDRGAIVLDLFDDTPGTVKNFETLVGKGYYNGLKFHRVISNFMIQGGCPQGTGTGGPGYDIECEIVPARKHGAGALSMAHAGSCKHDRATGKKQGGRCSNGSQFFITHVATPHLDGVHTVFGQVRQGQDVVNAIKQGDKIKTVTVREKPKS